MCLVKGSVKKTRVIPYGIQGDQLKWLRSYLVNRKQYYSSVEYLNAGFTTWTSLLFPIYMIDIDDYLYYLEMIFLCHTVHTHTSYLKLKLTAIFIDWVNTWLIKINPNKTEFLFISNTLPSDCINLYFQNSLLDSCGNHRHLGIPFSENCKWALSYRFYLFKCFQKRCQFYGN